MRRRWEWSPCWGSGGENRSANPVETQVVRDRSNRVQQTHGAQGPLKRNTHTAQQVGAAAQCKTAGAILPYSSPGDTAMHCRLAAAGERANTKNRPSKNLYFNTMEAYDVLTVCSVHGTQHAKLNGQALRHDNTAPRIAPQCNHINRPNSTRRRHIQRKRVGSSRSRWS